MVFARLVDWTWHDDSSYGPGMLSWFHFLWLFIAIAGAIGCVYLARAKKSEKQDSLVILIMDLLLIATEIPKQILYHVEYYGYLRIDTLPFSFCSIPMFVALLGSLVKEGKIKRACFTFLSFYGIIGGLAVLVYPVTLNTPFVYSSLQTMFWHSVLLWMGVYLIAAKKYGREYKKEMLLSSALFLALSLCAVVANESLYYGYLKPLETPVISLDRDPGSYEYYKYGAFDEENDKYIYLKANEEGEISTVFEPKEATTFVITYPEGDNYDIFYITYEGKDEETRYIEIAKTNGVLGLVSAAEPSSTWAFALLGGDHYVFASEVDGVSYCLSYAKDGSLAVVGVDAFPHGNLEPDFIRVEVAREGDAANFFFISNHCETTIPVLNLIQPHVPYVVFILIYLLSFFAVSNGVWGIAKLIRFLMERKND